MARYTNFFMTASPQQAISQALVSALEACNLNLVYQDPVCIVAKERPGQVSFAQLATVELLISPPTLENGGSKVDLVVKKRRAAAANPKSLPRDFCADKSGDRQCQRATDSSQS